MMKFLLCLHSPVSSRLHLSSCSLIGSVEDRGVLTTILMIYFSCLNDLEQLLSREPLCKCTFSRSRLHPSSCSQIGSVEDRGVLTTILMIYFGCLNDLSGEPPCKFFRSRPVLFVIIDESVEDVVILILNILFFFNLKTHLKELL